MNITEENETINSKKNFTFERLNSSMEFLNSHQMKEKLLQWNLDSTLSIHQFKFSGYFNRNNLNEFHLIIEEFLRDNEVTKVLNLPTLPETKLINEYIICEELYTNVMNAHEFIHQRLEDADVISSSGNIRGCYEEQYEGIIVGDLLREMLLNHDSQNTDIFPQKDKRELLFQLFRLFAIGGSMNQPDPTISQYLEMSKSLYKNILTIYK